MLTAIAKITVIPIETGANPSVYAPIKAKTTPIAVERATSFICEIDRMIDGCIVTTAVITATMPKSRPKDSVTIIDKATRSEEHTSELQSRGHLVCRLLLEKK